MIEAFAAELQQINPTFVAFEVLALLDDISGEQNPLAAYAASADPDILYLHEALKAPDRKQFIEAMQKEIQMQTDNGHHGCQYTFDFTL